MSGGGGSAGAGSGNELQDTSVGHRARPRPAPRLQLPGLAPPLGEPLRLAARDRDRRAARAGALAARRAARDRGRLGRGQRAPRARRADRGGRTRAGHGAPACTAREARLVRADRPQHRPEPGLVDVRIDHHRHHGRGALEAPVRLAGHVVLDDRVRPPLLGARDARADRLRTPLPAQVRLVGADLLHGLPDVLGDLEGQPPCVLGAAGKGWLPDLRPGDRPRDRERRLLDAAGRRLHTLLPLAARGVLGCGARLPRADDLVHRARHPRRARTRDRGRPVAPGRRRSGRAA